MKLKNKREVNWNDIFSVEGEEEQIEQDAQLLMFRFLSEVEKYQELKGITKKALAEKVNTSASYITQLFRGDKPLNFNTIAKFQKALAMKFNVSSQSTSQECIIDNEVQFLEKIKKYYTGKGGYWTYNNFDLVNKALESDKYNIKTSIDKLKQGLEEYDSEAIPA